MKSTPVVLYTVIHSYQSHSTVYNLATNLYCMFLPFNRDVRYSNFSCINLDSQLRLRFWKNLQYPTSWLLRTISYQCEWDELNFCSLFNYDVLMEIDRIYPFETYLLISYIWAEHYSSLEQTSQLGPHVICPMTQWKDINLLNQNLYPHRMPVSR